MSLRRPLYQYAVELGCEDQVVYTSTFSKILAPGMRIGWIVMPDRLAQQTVIVKQAADLCNTGCVLAGHHRGIPEHEPSGKARLP